MCPPWIAHAGFPSGYHLIFLNPPSPANRVDLLRLALEWTLATIVAAGLYFAWPFKSSLPVVSTEEVICPGYVFQSVGDAYIVSKIDEQGMVHFYGIKKDDENFCDMSDFRSIIDL